VTLGDHEPKVLLFAAAVWLQKSLKCDAFEERIDLL
jgi:hypothetical protein